MAEGYPPAPRLRARRDFPVHRGFDGRDAGAMRFDVSGERDGAAATGLRSGAQEPAATACSTDGCSSPNFFAHDLIGLSVRTTIFQPPSDSAGAWSATRS